MIGEDLVSIIVPAYNMESRIDVCIESILNQSYTNLEIIIVDDGSTDRTYDKVKSHANEDGRIRIIQHEKN